MRVIRGEDKMAEEPKDPMLTLMIQIEEARDAGNTALAKELEQRFYSLGFDSYKNALNARQEMAELADSQNPDVKAAASRNHTSLDVMANALGKALRNYVNT